MVDKTCFFHQYSHVLVLRSDKKFILTLTAVTIVCRGHKLYRIVAAREVVDMLTGRPFRGRSLEDNIYCTFRSLNTLEIQLK